MATPTCPVVPLLAEIHEQGEQRTTAMPRGAASRPNAPANQR